MRDPLDVIAQVINGHGPALAEVLEVSVSRCNEILSTDNPYPRAKRLIRAIAQTGLDVRPIKADLDAMFEALISESGITTPELTRDLFEAGQSVLEGKPVAEQRADLLKAIADAECKLKEIDGNATRQQVKPIVADYKNNGRKR